MKLFKSLVVGLFVFSINNVSMADKVAESTFAQNSKLIQGIPKKYKEWQERTKLLKEIESYARLADASYKEVPKGAEIAGYTKITNKKYHIGPEKTDLSIFDKSELRAPIKNLKAKITPIKINSNDDFLTKQGKEVINLGEKAGAGILNAIIKTEEVIKNYSRKKADIVAPKIAKGLTAIKNLVSEIDIGFHAGLYENTQNENEIVIAFRGTDTSDLKNFAKDLAVDIGQLLLEIMPHQYNMAIKYVEKIKRENPNKNIHLTGHSLGGGLAQYAGAMLSIPVTGFNSAGLSESALEKIAKNNRNYEKYTKKNTQHIIYENDWLSDSMELFKGKNLGEKYIVGQDAPKGRYAAHDIGDLVGYIKNRRNDDFWKQEKYTALQGYTSLSLDLAIDEQNWKRKKEKISRKLVGFIPDGLTDYTDDLKTTLAESAEEDTGQYGYSTSLGTIDGGNYLANNQIKTVDVLHNQKFQMLNTDGHTYGGLKIPLVIDDDYASNNYKYTVWGNWGDTNYSFQSGSDKINVNVAADKGLWVTGDRTKSDDIPKSGSAVYSGKTEGFVGSTGAEVDGLISLMANFSTNKVDATLSASGTGFSQSRTFNDIDLTRNNGHNRAKYYKEADINSYGYAESYINGTFYGPNAEEAGGQWRINGGTQGVANGVFRAKQ